MEIRSKKYIRTLIAILFLAVLCGRPVSQLIVGFLADDLIPRVSANAANAANAANNAADSEESGTQEGETDADPVHKGTKKSCPDMEPWQSLPHDPVEMISGRLIASHHYHTRLSSLFQQVPTRPPLSIRG